MGDIKYKAGDVVLVEHFNLIAWIIKLGNLWTRLFDPEKVGINYNHIGIMISEKHIVEALGNGVIMRPFPYKKNFAVYRKKNLTVNSREILKSAALDQVGEKYSWFLICVICILKFLRIEWLFTGIGYTGKICSVVVAKCYEKLGYLFKRNECVDVIDPGDIAEHVMISEEWTKVEVR